MKKERKKKYTTAITKTEGLRLLGTHRERPKVLRTVNTQLLL